MTEADIRERARLLAEKRQQILDEINRLGSELGRVEGAIQDCEFWASRITGVTDVERKAGRDDSAR